MTRYITIPAIEKKVPLYKKRKAPMIYSAYQLACGAVQRETVGAYRFQLYRVPSSRAYIVEMHGPAIASSYTYGYGYLTLAEARSKFRELVRACK